MTSKESVRQMRSRRLPNLPRFKVEQYLKPLEIPQAEQFPGNGLREPQFRLLLS